MTEKIGLRYIPSIIITYILVDVAANSAEDKLFFILVLQSSSLQSNELLNVCLRTFVSH